MAGISQETSDAIQAAVDSKERLAVAEEFLHKAANALSTAAAEERRARDDSAKAKAKATEDGQTAVAALKREFGLT